VRRCTHNEVMYAHAVYQLRQATTSMLAMAPTAVDTSGVLLRSMVIMSTWVLTASMSQARVLRRGLAIAISLLTHRPELKETTPGSHSSVLPELVCCMESCTTMTKQLGQALDGIENVSCSNGQTFEASTSISDSAFSTCAFH
jgi:hypothetical protein